MHRVPARSTVVLACALWLAGASLVEALDPNKRLTQYVHDVWGLEQGLPELTVSAIAQTPDGYLWLATASGLVRFDGVTFTTFTRRTTPELPDNSIRALLVDRKGTLWVGTASGLVRFENRQFTGADRLPRFPFDAVSCLYEDADGSLWAGSPGQGLAHLSAGRWTVLRQTDGLASDFVWAVHRDRSGALWVGTRAGLSRLAGDAFSTFTTVDGLTDNRVVTFTEEADGALWIGAYGGPNVRRDTRFTTLPPSPGLAGEPVFDIQSDPDGGVWLGTFGGGLVRFREGKSEAFTSKEGLLDDHVRALHIDPEGSLWIGTQAGGLHRLRDGSVTPFGVLEGLPNDLVRSVLEDRSGTLWVGTNGGLAALRPQTKGSIGLQRQVALPDVYSLFEDRGGTLWVTTQRNGVFRVAAGGVMPFRHPDLPAAESVTVLSDDGEGGVWLGTYGGGLKRLRDGSVTTYTRKDGLAGDFVWSLLGDPDGGVWVGTDKGLSRFENGRFANHPEAAGLAGRMVKCLWRDAAGILWACSDQGLTRFDGRTSADFSSHNGLVDDVYQVLDDSNGFLWMSTPRGIVRARLSDLEAVAHGRAPRAVADLYREADGMRSRECNGSTHPAGWKGRDGRLWFPTVRGVVMIDPSRLAINSRPPPVVIEAFIADGIRRDSSWKDEGLVVEPGSGAFEVQYTGLSLAVPGRVRFKYRLEGFDRDWVDAGTRRAAYYTNIPPGRYRFKVIASNNDGVWNGIGASLPLRLKPHFYQTTWFYALAVMPIGLAAWGLHRFRLARALAIERMRTQIATDLHDDVGASLSQIAVLSEVVRAQVSPADGRLSAPLGRIADVAREAVDSMSDIVWALDPQKDRVADLAARMRRFAGDSLGAAGIDLEFRAGGNPDAPLPPRVRRELFLMLKECVNNVVRHAHATRASVDLRLEHHRVVLSVADDGRGFEVASTPAEGQGLRSLERRTRRLGGTLQIDSRPGVGTTVTVTLA